MSRLFSPARVPDPPTTPPAPPRVMLALYSMVIARAVRELATYMWEKGWRAGRQRPGPVMCPAHPDMELENCPWRCYAPPESRPRSGAAMVAEEDSWRAAEGLEDAAGAAE